MVNIHPQYLVDENQVRKAVLLSTEDWERVLEEIEDLEDIRDYYEAKSGPQDAIPFEQAMREIKEQENKEK